MTEQPTGFRFILPMDEDGRSLPHNSRKLAYTERCSPKPINTHDRSNVN